MDEVLSRFKKEHGRGQVSSEEKKWLQDLYQDIVKYVQRKELIYSASEICCAVLNHIKKHRSRLDDSNGACHSWLPLDHSIAPILKLMQHVRNVVVGGHSDQLADDLSEGELAKRTGFKLAERVPFFLLGYLTPKPSHIKPEHMDMGTLYLEDNTAAIPCELNIPDKECLGKLVIISKYNYVPGPQLTHQKGNNCEWKRAGYLEVSGKCEPVLEAYEEMNRPPPSLSLNKFLQDNVQGKANLRGEITALSPIHSIRSSKPFFLIQLASQETGVSASMVVQGSHHMHWRNFLRIQGVYVFTDVRTTTMNKGTVNERRILAVSKNSEFFSYLEPGLEYMTQASKRSCNATNEVGIKRLKTAAASNHESLQPQPHHCEDRSAANTNQPLTISYSGIITKCIKPEAGLYELDDKYKLFLSHQPLVNMARSLRVGARLILHNVHVCKKIKGLGCCTRSTVEIVAFSKLESPWKPCRSSESPLFLLAQNLTVAEYAEVLQLCDQLLRKFSPLFRTRQLIAYSTESQRQSHSSKRSVVEHILDEARSRAESASRNKRNIYAEFFDEPHDCNPSRPSALSLKCALSVTEILEIVQSKVENRPWITGNRNPADGPTDWCYQVYRQQDIHPMASLLGCLRGSSSTGQLQFFDQTGAVDCVIAPVDQDVSGHCCLSDCCMDCTLSSPSGAEMDRPCHGRPRCPFAHLWYQEALVKAANFQVVVERLTVSSAFREADALTFPGEKNSVLRIYFQFSLEDAEILAYRQKASPVRTGNGGTEEEGSSRVLWEGTSERGSSARDNPSAADRAGGVSATCVPGQNSANRGQPTVNCLLFLLRHKEDPALRISGGKLSYACALDIKIVGWRSANDAGALIGNTMNRKHAKATTCARESRGENFAGNECSQHFRVCFAEFEPQSKSSVLKFADCRIHLLPLLRPGCLYVLTERSPNEGRSGILQAMKARDTQVIEFSQEMSIGGICSCQARSTPTPTRDLLAAPPRAVCGSSLDIRSKRVSQAVLDAKERLGTEDALMDVVGVLSESDQRHACAKVSFRGLVVCREVRMSDTPDQCLAAGLLKIPKFGLVKKDSLVGLGLGFCCVGNRTILLKVRDIHSINVLDAYVDLSRSPYVCGILPGAVIQCRRFLRKFSRSTGRIYCTFDACSSISVEQQASVNFLGPDSDGLGRISGSRIAAECKQNQIPNRYLVEFIRSESEGVLLQRIYRVRCRVVAVQTATVSWKCARCSELVVREECRGGCTSVRKCRFTAVARCAIEDGTGEAQLYVYDHLVPLVLQLSSQQWSHLRDVSMGIGELSYQRFRYGREDPPKVDTKGPTSKATDAIQTWARYCCSPTLPRLVAVSCKHFRATRTETYDTRVDAGFNSRSVTIGATEFSTLVLPKLMLRAEGITEVCLSDEARGLLEQASF